MEEDYPLIPTKRQKEDAPDLPTNIVTSGRYGSQPKTNSPEMTAPSSGVHSLRVHGWLKPEPKNWDGPWRNHYRSVANMSTAHNNQVSYFVNEILTLSEQRSLISKVPITIWDDEAAVATMSNLEANYNQANVAAGGGGSGKAKTMWYFKESSTFKHKNNSETTVRMDIAFYNYRVSTSRYVEQYLVEGAQQWYNKNNPNTPFIADPKIVLYDLPLVNEGKSQLKKVMRATRWLMPGQTLVIRTKVGFYSDPTNAVNLSQTYGPGTGVLILRAEGELGHNATTKATALKEVKQIDMERETFQKTYKKETVIRDFSLTTFDIAPAEIDVEVVNQFGEMKDQ